MFLIRGKFFCREDGSEGKATVNQCWNAQQPTAVFFTWCQESKPANPLRFEEVCAFTSKFHWGLLCYLAQASHSVESKCSLLKVCWRQLLICSNLEKAEKRKGWKANVLLYCQKLSTSRPGSPLLQPPLLITLAVRKHQANSTNECLINTVCCGRGRQPTCSWLIPSLPLSLFSTFFSCLFSPSPSHSLKTEENKGRDRRKAI